MQIQQDYSNLISYKPSVSATTTADGAPKEPTKDEVTLARFKKTMSECKYAAAAVIILYCSLKRIFRNEEIATYARNKKLISKGINVSA